MSITLGLDVDGVLLDYITGFVEYLEAIGVPVALRPEQVDCFSFRTFLVGKTQEEIEQLIGDFSVTEGFGRIPAFPGAVDAINRIKDRFGDDISIVAITSAGTSEETLRLRKKNLELFPFDDIQMLPLGGDKTKHLAELGSDAIFIDDLKKNVAAAESVGVRAILFRQLYNAMDHHDLTMQAWDEEGYNTVLSTLIEVHNKRRLKLAS